VKGRSGPSEREGIPLKGGDARPVVRRLATGQAAQRCRLPREPGLGAALMGARPPRLLARVLAPGRNGSGNCSQRCQFSDQCRNRSDGARATLRWVALTCLWMRRLRKAFTFVEPISVILDKFRKAILELDCQFLPQYGQIGEPCLQLRRRSGRSDFRAARCEHTTSLRISGHDDCS
jgi:hypothetical protein